MASTVLQPGHKYRVTYLPAGCRVNRQMVAVFMEREGSTLYWHGEEEFGTSTMRCETGWNKLVSVAPVSAGVRCKAPRAVKP